MTATDAHVRFAADGTAQVESFLRLTARTCLYCHVYADRAPILSIDDAHVKVSITVPDTAQVTEQDLAVARQLAGIVTRYVAELEHRAVLGEDTADPGDCAGRAA